MPIEAEAVEIKRPWRGPHLRHRQRRLSYEALPEETGSPPRSGLFNDERNHHRAASDSGGAVSACRSVARASDGRARCRRRVDGGSSGA